MTIRGTISFRDGHVEDTLYCEVFPDGGRLFATVSGIYYKDANNKFTRITKAGEMLFVGDVPCDIDEAWFDDRITIEYNFGESKGMVQVDKDASKKEIELAILSDMTNKLELSYKRVD